MALPQFAGAATIQVTTTVDESLLGKAGCSLREAVQTANANTNYGGCTRSGGNSLDDTIRLQGGSTYPLALPGVEDANAGGDLDVTGTLAIEVGGAGRATIDGGDIDRVVEVRPAADLTATDLVIQNGEVATTQNGGGIYNQGRLVLRSSVVQENHILGPNGSGGGAGIGGPFTGVTTILSLTKVKDNVDDGFGTGGGINQIGGVLKVKKSTISGNSAYGGGGITAYDDIQATVKASTLSDNTATQEQYGGGGIYRYDGNGATQFPMRVTNSTISTNRSAGGGGGIIVNAGYTAVELNATTLTLNIADFDSDNADQAAGSGGAINGPASFTNSIVAGNAATNAGAADCYQASGGAHNVLGRNEGCVNPGGVLDAGLGPLKNNGGPTKTHALLKGSPAIGKANSSAPGKDQRGRRRDSDPDAGAYERGA
jgi:CSLREA domain-containing protein